MKKILLVIIALTLSVGMWAEKITLTAADFMVTQDGDWIYDKTEKRVNVELSPEYIKPSADVITIYYNNDRMVKPINPGTYQVYIDMTETDTYAAVTGITSETWKFTIIDPLPEIKEAAIKELEGKKEDAVDKIRKKAMGYELTTEVQWAIEQGNEKIMLAKEIAKNYINEATDESTIQKEKHNGLNAMEEETDEALVAIEAAIAGYKEGMKNNINNIAMNAKNTIDALGVYYTVTDQAKAEIDKAVAEAEASINNATSEEDVNNAKSTAQNKIYQQLANVQAYYEKLQAAKQAALTDIDKVATDAKSKIDGFHIEESVKNDAKDAIDAIVATTKSDINAATSADVITAAKEEGIQALKDVYNVQREQERLATLDAVTVTQTAVDDYSYMLEDGVQFTFDGDNVHMTVNGEDEADFTLSETVAIIVCPAHTFKLKANQDPAHTENYYSTFFTSEGAYKVPETAEAYIGKVESGEDIDVLRLTPTVGGLIPASEAVVLRATQSDITLMPSSRQDAASDDNMLLGSDDPMTLPTNSYALSLGQHGVGFYLFSGSELPANKAYLTLAAQSNGLRFSFSDATDIDTPQVDGPARAYNLQGQQVSENYQGIVIVNGKKMLKQ